MWRVDFPDAAFAAGVKTVVLTVRHDSIKTANKEVEIDAPVNVTQISGDTEAADNLEAMYDGTGYTDGAAPATQTQLSQLSTGSGGLAVNADSATVTTGTPTGTVANTEALDGTTYDVAAVGGNTDFYFEFDVGAGGVCTGVEWQGYVQSNGDSVDVQFYDWVATSYVTVATLDGSNGSTVVDETFNPVNGFTGSGANEGLVRLRFNSATTTEIFTDRVRAIYTYAALGIANGSTITLSESAANTNFVGRGWVLALGGQDISGAYIFQSINISGTGTGTNGSPFIIQQCLVSTCTLAAYGFLENCALADVVTLTSTGGVSADAFTIIACSSAVAGSGSPHIDASGVTKTTQINVRRWSGGLEVTLTADCTMSIDVVSGGTITVNGTGGTLNIRGMVEGVTDNSSGSVTITQNAAINRDFINAEVDTALNGAFNIDAGGGVDANITHINGAEVTGDGDATPWDAA